MPIEDTYVYSGLQRGVVYNLNEKGRPAAADDGLAYIGREIYATKLYNLNLPQSRRIPHTGNDRLLATQIFPTLEPATGELTVGAEDLAMIADLSGSVIKDFIGGKMLPHMTDLQGNEPNVGMILHQAALSRRQKAQGFHFHIIPNTKAVVRLPGAGEAPIDLVYDLAPNPTEYHLWGEALAPLADIYDPFSGVSDTNAHESGIWSGFMPKPVRLAAFIAQTAQVEFEFPSAARPAAVDAEIVQVWVGDPTADALEEVDPDDYTLAADSITFDSAAGKGIEVQVVYQQRV
jgi:hypothetical protein